MPHTCRRLLAGCLLFIGLGASAAAPVHTARFSDLAVRGHDVVAYFDEGRPVKGTRRWSTEYQGATWRFASEAHRDAFVADPERYAPQFGGYCAWAVAEGYTAPGDPGNWAIVDGRLYLNYDDAVQARWNADRAGFIERAEANWPGVLD